MPGRGRIQEIVIGVIPVVLQPLQIRLQTAFRHCHVVARLAVRHHVMVHQNGQLSREGLGCWLFRRGGRDKKSRSGVRVMLWRGRRGNGQVRWNFRFGAVPAAADGQKKQRQKKDTEGFFHEIFLSKSTEQAQKMPSVPDWDERQTFRGTTQIHAENRVHLHPDNGGRPAVSPRRLPGEPNDTPQVGSQPMTDPL